MGERQGDRKQGISGEHERGVLRTEIENMIIATVIIANSIVFVNSLKPNQQRECLLELLQQFLNVQWYSEAPCGGMWSFPSSFQDFDFD